MLYARGNLPIELKYVDAEFVLLLNDIGRYGHDKYGEESFQHRRTLGDTSRGPNPRTSTQRILDHARAHMSEYQNQIVHDYFKSLKYQLAAAGFNMMMEFYFSKGSTK